MHQLARVTMTVPVLTACTGEAKNAERNGSGATSAAPAASAGDASARSATTAACELITTSDLSTVFAPFTEAGSGTGHLCAEAHGPRWTWNYSSPSPCVIVDVLRYLK